MHLLTANSQSTCSSECCLLTTTGTSGFLAPSWPSSVWDTLLWSSFLRSSRRRTCAMLRTLAGVLSRFKSPTAIPTMNQKANGQACDDSGPWHAGRKRGLSDKSVLYIDEEGRPWRTHYVERRRKGRWNGCRIYGYSDASKLVYNYPHRVHENDIYLHGAVFHDVEPHVCLFEFANSAEVQHADQRALL